MLFRLILDTWQLDKFLMILNYLWLNIGFIGNSVSFLDVSNCLKTIRKEIREQISHIALVFLLLNLNNKYHLGLFNLLPRPSIYATAN